MAGLAAGQRLKSTVCATEIMIISAPDGDIELHCGGAPMTDGNIEDQTRACLDAIGDTLRSANCDYSDVVKSMVWLKSREDFPGFNTVYGEYFPEGPPARSALVSDFLVDIRVEIECIAYKPD